MKNAAAETNAVAHEPQITLPSRIVTRMLDRILEHTVAGALEPIAGFSVHGAPRIGDPWLAEGGIYAGVIRGPEGKPDQHLIVAMPKPDAPLDWEAAGKWAGVFEIDGHRDFRLPTRKEQALLFANVAELFEKDWYWSGEQHAGSAEYAWMQTFGDGGQDASHQSFKYLARAVRSFPI